MCFSLYLKFETNIFLKLLVLETKKKRRGEERQRQREEILNLVKSTIHNPYSAININNNVVSYFVSILGDVILIKFHLACSKVWLSHKLLHCIAFRDTTIPWTMWISHTRTILKGKRNQDKHQLISFLINNIRSSASKIKIEHLTLYSQPQY